MCIYICHLRDCVCSMAWTSTACTHTHMYRGANDGTPRRVLLDVVERVLRDVADARVRVLPDGARRRLDLAREALDEGGFTGTVRADARHTRRERHLDGRLLDGDLVVARVLEGHVDDLDEGLALGFLACVENVAKPPRDTLASMATSWRQRFRHVEVQ